MVINPLQQNLEYFKHDGNIIKSSEIDARFNDIVNYLNNEIIFKLNSILDENIVGSTIQSNVSSILKSNSSGGYIWKKIDNDDFINNSIDIRKLNYNTLNQSIFSGVPSWGITLVQNQDTLNNILVCTNESVTFDKINSKYIDSSTKITSDKIQYNSITSNNLREIKPTIAAESIIGEHFKQRVITTEKIIDNSITLESFNKETQNLLNNYIWGSIIPINFVDLNINANRTNIVNNWDRDFLMNKAFNYNLPVGENAEKSYQIPLSKFNKFYVKNIIKYYTNGAKITDLSLTDPNGNKVGAEKRYYLSPNNFKKKSINPNRLVCWYHTKDNNYCHNINDIIANDTLTIDNFTSNIQAKIRKLGAI